MTQTKMTADKKDGTENITEKKIESLLQEYPFVADFFEQNTLDIKGCENKTLKTFLEDQKEHASEDKAMDTDRILDDLKSYIYQMIDFLGIKKENTVKSLTILAGHNKNKEKETFGAITILPSQVVAIVGPTGSGKSRLLADIEWAAWGDTPTGRSIMINEEKPDFKWRYSANKKLVAQLSQNMNFVIDLSAGEFIRMHAASRMVENPEKLAEKILLEANKLAGESFLAETPVTSLSGGQSRALMIADTAVLSASPIVLIDEIENAGIDRKKALDLLVSQDKIVLMATHDPLLALMADRRIVIKNGGIHALIETSKQEKELLAYLNSIDSVMQESRRILRSGEILKSEALPSIQKQ
ncbi:ATP-binding cassette domain-containing protein [Treponema parvum]|uniref:ATP-binding cassette domain-containing protein n=1 Tax=Treponema parvum TaxID=138851 RepID=UPI001AEC0B78|nr:ATP-binding cassette domain-containing protein [Treponema parvum]